jgi:hypothetical protein
MCVVGLDNGYGNTKVVYSLGGRDASVMRAPRAQRRRIVSL